ncbi:MAG: cob(I)yrinic acid a,c-diamide adenosyltransferase [Candidatus Omnitrophica bacterium]|jgi:cob(I)alamin adenosyltransferase|nr:cob(I)yrinic acid a,c-diamide adenosyltransferase [Candidatus Omnitrophota bacterium]
MVKSIVTKFGDKGKTLLYSGTVVDKDHISIETCGEIDELSSYLGLAKSLIKSKRTKKIIEFCQQDLFLIGTEVALEAKDIIRLKERINKSFISNLERRILQLEKKGVIKKRCFHLPGKNIISGNLDVARAITRRVERKIVTLAKKKKLKNKHILVYLNRLSDFLYLLARFYESK